jgi:phage antirepressor YoqD-like protein
MQNWLFLWGKQNEFSKFERITNHEQPRDCGTHRQEHRNVVADIDRMCDELNLNTADFLAVYTAENNQQYRCYNLSKRESLILVSGYSVKMRAAIIDRWQELEAQQAPQVPQTYAAALLEAGRLASEVERQSVVIDNQIEKLALAAPAVQFMNDFVVAKGDVSLRGAAKELGHSPIAFNRQLGELGIIYKLDGVWTAKQSQVNAGRLAMKVAICDDGEHRPQCTITPKGMEYIAVKLAELNASAE